MNGIAVPTSSQSSPRTRAGRLPASIPAGGPRLKALAAATALALAMLPEAGFGQVIGPIDVRSRLGERFFAAVPVRVPDGILNPGCLRIGPNPNAPAGAAALEGVRIRVGSADTVVIETVGTVTSPVVGLRLHVGCETPAVRDFVVVEPSTQEPAAVAAQSAPVAVAPALRAAAPAAKPPQRAASAPTTRKSPPAARPAKPVARTEQGTPAPRAPVSADAPTAVAARQMQNRVSELRTRSDDHAAALLALEDRLALLQKQAELLKAQLEHRLATTPQSVAATGPATVPNASPNAVTAPSAQGAAPGAATAPTAPSAEPSTAATSTTAASAAPSTTAASAAPTPTATSAAPTPTAAAPVAAPTAAPAATPQTTAAAPSAQTPPSSATSNATTQTPAPAARGQNVLDLLFDWRVAGGIAALLFGALAFKIRRRPIFKPASPAPAMATAPQGSAIDAHEKTQEVPILAQPHRAVATEQWQVTTPVAAEQTAEWVPPPSTDSMTVPELGNAALSTWPGGMTREFHITQQFQPDAERTVALSSPEEIVQQARTHYMEDNDVFKAIDLLEMAVSARRDSVRPWQALFAIYRRENMPERFQRLALAYRGIFGQDSNWPAIRALGLQIDPNNALYSGASPDEDIPPDLIERWLGVPLDFTAHLLANEMHDQLMDTYSGRKRRRRQ